MSVQPITSNINGANVQVKQQTIVRLDLEGETQAHSAYKKRISHVRTTVYGRKWKTIRGRAGADPKEARAVRLPASALDREPRAPPANGEGAV